MRQIMIQILVVGEVLTFSASLLRVAITFIINSSYLIYEMIYARETCWDIVTMNGEASICFGGSVVSLVLRLLVIKR